MKYSYRVIPIKLPEELNDFIADLQSLDLNKLINTSKYLSYEAKEAIQGFKIYGTIENSIPYVKLIVETTSKKYSLQHHNFIKHDLLPATRNMKDKHRIVRFEFDYMEN